MRLALILVLLAACGPAEPPAPIGRLAFVRGGVLAPAGSGGRVVGDGARELHELGWGPGQEVSVGGLGGVAPRVPECPSLFHVELGDVSRLAAGGDTAPDTSLAFSPDGAKLAVGSYRGEVVVVDGWTGAELARRRLAETMVKHVAWSPDGGTLYASEQSPDALLHALDPSTLEARWSLRLADEVGTSPAPDGEDIYGVYTLPAAYELEVLPGGDVLVGATHGWNDAQGTRLNRARLLRISPTGEPVAAWPKDGAADAAFYRYRVDVEGGLLIVSIGRSSAGPAPEGIPVGGVQVLRLEDLSPVRSFVPPPLSPHFDATFIWEALDLDAARNIGIVGLADGRVFGFALDGGSEWRLDVSTPVMAGDVPISSSIGFGLLYEDAFVLQTAATNIPYSAATPAARPPSVHPKENALWAWGLDGELRWTWNGPWQLNGLVLGQDGQTAVVGTRTRASDSREDAFGALLFRLAGEGSGNDRFLAFCPTEGPTFFRSTMSADGRVAVTEHPWKRADGSLAGSYRVTVLR